METEAWIGHLPAACRMLVAPGLLCQAALNEKLEEIAAEFIWLDEIYNEAVRLFSIKSTKLEQMPKTPSLKLKGKRGGKLQIVKVISEDDDNGSPVKPKGVPTKLTFYSPKNLAVDNDSAETANARPVRNCRKTSKAAYVDDTEQQPKRSKRQSKKAGNNQISDRSLCDLGQLLQKPLSSATEQVKVETLTDNVPTVKTCTSVISKQKSEEKSPSVRDRTKAYESMLKIRMSESPALKHSSRASTSKLAYAVSNVGSPGLVLGSPKGHKSSPACGQPMNGTSVQQSSKLCLEADGTKQTRTRLKLKKQKQQQEEDMDTVISEQLGGQHLNPGSQPTTDGGGHAREHVECHSETLNETETVITEIFDVGEGGKPAQLRHFEIVQTKTTPLFERQRPLVAADCVSDQGFNDGDMDSSRDSQPVTSTSHDDQVQLASSPPVQTRDHQDNSGCDGDGECRPNKDSGVVSELASRADSTFVKEKHSLEPENRGTRTRTKAEKEVVSHETPAERMTRTRQRKQEETLEIVSHETPTERMTRTRQRKQEEAPEIVSHETPTERMTRTRQRKQEETLQTAQNLKSIRVAPLEAQTVQGPSAVTRSRMKKALDPSKLCGSDDEIIASSPVVGVSRTSLSRGAKKRIADERGLSPRPKRSCVGDESSLNLRSPPQSTSSPLKKKDAMLLREVNDKVASPRRSPRAFKFSSAQKVPHGFLNRTPGFGQNTSKLCSFLSNTPTCRSTSFLTSFLKRNTPPPKQNNQVLQEQKRQKLLEKESRDKERMKRAADLRKRRIEDQKRLREEKEQKVAEAREMRFRNEQEYKNRINKKLEDKATVKVKLMEERIKEEKEKQKQRIKKQIEADTRRRFEEEERLKKLLEQEEEAKMHEEFMQRKKEFEEAERRRQIAEEKRKQEERLAELEQKRQEELTRLRQAEEEKDRDRERTKLDKEKQIAQERSERERIEREKREEKDRKIQEEIEKLKAMERERLRCQQERLQHQKHEETHQNVIKQMINKHNSSLSKPAAGLNTSTGGNTSSSKFNSYEITPVKERFISKNKNPDNYDIEDKGSDDSTDDEEAPKKKLPEWATGIPLNTALIRQHMNPPDVEAIFRTRWIEPPNLVLVFPGKKRAKYIQRTSSAVWNSPPMPQQ